MKYSFFYLLIVGLSLISCDKRTFFEGPDSYEDGFEAYTSLEDALIEDDVFWSFTQRTRAENHVQIDSSFAHSGKKSLKFTAALTENGDASKASIAKQKMAFWEGETVRISAWYFIEGNKPLPWLFLMDLEEQATIGAGPGMRIALVDDQLRIEYKFNERDILQDPLTSIPFPRNQWVKIEWEITLSQQDEGTVKLWQDDKLLIEVDNQRTLPKDLLYFQQGTKGMYSSIEIGITANSFENDAIIWVDDFEAAPR